jgi:glycosyltransferase involved in cell wall biosynthesis
MPAIEKVTLSILMPCLNEARSLPNCIAKAKTYLARQPFSGEIVIADNGSTDGSREIAESLGVRVVCVQRRGYGRALLAGIEAARGEYVIMGDADDSYDFASLDAFVEALQAGNDLVVGNRFRGGIEKGAMPPLHRYLGNPLLTMIGRALYRSPLRDFNCGLRGCRRDAILRLDLAAPGMEFAVEMIVKATINGLKIAEVPTTRAPDGRGRRPHLRSWRDGWRTIRFFLQLSPEGLFLYPGLALATVGGIASLILCFTDIGVGSVTFSFHTLIMTSALTVAGLQSIAFWVLAKSVAIQRKLLHPDPLYRRIRALFSLEICLVVAGGLLAAALAIACYALIYWANLSFGNIDDASLIRIVCAASFFTIVGIQLALSSFFFYLIDQSADPR